MISFKDVIILALVALMQCGCSKEGAHIHGNITSLPDDVVYLRVYEGSVRTIDSTRSISGRFQFDLPDILPNMLYLQFADADYFIPILIDGGEVSVSGNYNYPEEIQASGTPANDALFRFREQGHKYNIMIEAIDLELKRFSKGAVDSVKIKVLKQKRASLQARQDSFRKEFVRANRGSLVSAFLVASALKDNTTKQQIDSLISELEPTMADNAFLRRLRRKQTEFK